MELYDRADHSSGRRYRAIPATCDLRHGQRSATSLAVSKRGGGIVLDPQVTGACVMSLDDTGAATLRDLLTEWLR